jgi:hypothetical protein
MDASTRQDDSLQYISNQHSVQPVLRTLKVSDNKASKLQQNAVHSPPIGPLPFHRRPDFCFYLLTIPVQQEFPRRRDTKVKLQNKFLNLNSLFLCGSLYKCNGVKYLSFPTTLQCYWVSGLCPSSSVTNGTRSTSF